MCTILMAWRCAAGADLVMAGNRDEFFGRASSDPCVLVERPRIAGGRDLVAGGTWMAVAADGRVALVTNRLTGELPDPDRLSRGTLPLAVLTEPDGAGPRTVVERIDASRYNACNILYASRSEAFVAHAPGDGSLRIADLEPGVHVLTLYDVDQPGNSKVAFLRDGVEAALAADARPENVLAAMQGLLAEHGDERRSGLDCGCVHEDGYGTVSSQSVIVWDSGRMSYGYTPGRPCEAPATDVSHLLG